MRPLLLLLFSVFQLSAYEESEEAIPSFASDQRLSSSSLIANLIHPASGTLSLCEQDMVINLIGIT